MNESSKAFSSLVLLGVENCKSLGAGLALSLCRAKGGLSAGFGCNCDLSKGPMLAPTIILDVSNGS